jgi:hypothetical protein
MVESRFKQGEVYTFRVTERSCTAEERERENVAQVKKLLRAVNSNGVAQTSLRR